MFKKTILSFSEGGTSEDWSSDPHLKFRSEILFFWKRMECFSPHYLEILEIGPDPHLDKIRSTLTEYLPM